MPDVYGSGGIYLPTWLLVTLATSGLRLWFYGVRSVYGTVRFLHLFGMSGFLGMLLLLEVKRLGFFAAESIQSARRPMLIVMNSAFALTLVTGLLLFLYDPIGAGLHTMFLPKLLLIALGVVHATYIERVPLMRKPAWRRGSAAAALAIWMLVIGCSTWNAVERPRNPADVHRLELRR